MATFRLPRRSQQLTVVAAVLATLVVPATLAALAPAAEARWPRTELTWQLRPTGTDAGLRGLDAVSYTVAWATGSDGTVLRTVDGGRSWQDVAPAGTGTLAFRDVEAFDKDTATILAIGTGDASRIYRTEDGGRTWRLAFTNPDPDAFYDCMAFFPDGRGLAMSDPVDGKFVIAASDDAGRSWRVLPRRGMPPALDGEFGFAASGTCLVTAGMHDAWFATGGAAARVFHSTDRGRTWTVTRTPMRSGATAGIYSLAFRDPRHGIAVGGDFVEPDRADRTAAVTDDGGRTWRLADDMPAGYRSGSAWLPTNPKVALAVGPTGSDVSTDGGRTWRKFDDGSFDSVDCAPSGGCWASGADGRAARLSIRVVS